MGTRGCVSAMIEHKRAIEVPQQTEERYRKLVENANDIIYTHDLEGNFTSANPATTRNYGYTTEEILRLNLTQIIDPKYLSLVRQKIRDKLDGLTVTEPCELLTLSKRGETIWVEVNAHLLKKDGHPIEVQGIARNITNRKEHEQIREAMVIMTNALRAAKTRSAMLPIILDQLHNLLKAEGTALAMRDPGSGETIIELAGGAWVNTTGTRLAPGEGISGHVIATGRAYRNDEVRSDLRVIRPDFIGDLCCVACFPLSVQGQAFGAVWVGRRIAIHDFEERLLLAISEIIANAIYRATQHEETERRLQHLSSLRTIDVALGRGVDLHSILNIILNHVTEQLDVDATDILLLNPDTQILEYTAGQGFRSKIIERRRLSLGEGQVGRAAQERRLIHIPNLRKTNVDYEHLKPLEGECFITYIAVPLNVKERLLGVLEIFHRSPLTLDQEWLDFMDALAGQTALAVERAELFDTLQRSNIELTQAYEGTIESWARILELRDRETEGHALRVSEMTVRLAQMIGMNDTELVHIRRGALLHDIGKLGIPDSILLKQGALTELEWEIIRQHPVYAYEMLSAIPFLHQALDIPYCHHEKWDGSGYPRGLMENQIPLTARIFAVVDVWDALHSDRPYRAAWPEGRILTYIQEQAGKYFDPHVVKIFIRLMNKEVR
jgi:PAS domain S-box-containing protein